MSPTPSNAINNHTIHPADHVWGKWPDLWSREELLDAFICCKLFPELHYMDNDNLAYVLGISHYSCEGMTELDVQELYDFLLATRTMRGNPFNYWQEMRDRNMREPDDYRQVLLAIMSFGRKSRPRVR